MAGEIPWILIAILILTLVIGIYFYKYKRERKKATDYRILYTIGITFLAY
jgi:hypothetical protein